MSSADYEGGNPMSKSNPDECCPKCAKKYGKNYVAILAQI
ncbi:MAG: hydrolase [Acidobacteriota bacterium]|nr:hydrolase [Acidobacteriota bacterium]